MSLINITFKSFNNLKDVFPINNAMYSFIIFHYRLSGTVDASCFFSTLN